MTGNTIKGERSGLVEGPRLSSHICARIRAICPPFWDNHNKHGFEYGFLITGLGGDSGLTQG